MKDVQIETVEMTVQQYCVSMLSDDGWTDPHVRADAMYRIEMLAHQLTATFYAPGQVLQNDRVLATYPTTLWDSVKARLGWRHNKTVVRLTEHLLFPNVSLKRYGRIGESVKLYIAPRISRYDFPGDDA